MLACLTACSGTALRQDGAAAERVELDSVPFFPQREYQCGPAALATVLVNSGVATTADELVPEVYLPQRHGSLQAEILGAARRHDRVPYMLAPTVPALLRELEAGRPVLVLQNFGSLRTPSWHYAVVVGYERERDRFILRTGITRRQTLAAERFIATWERGESWALIVLKPGELPADPAAVRYLQAVSGLEAAKRWETAGASYEAATVRWPDEPLTWFGLANVRLAQGRPREAESLYRQVLLRAANNVAARNNLALLLSRRGCPVQAQIEIERARIVAAGTPFAGEVADSAAEIKSRGAGTATSDAPCVEP
jgi:hypothetical protein